VLIFTAEFLYSFSTIMYSKMVMVRHLMQIVNFLAKRDL
jgi:hypothetical protein